MVPEPHASYTFSLSPTAPTRHSAVTDSNAELQAAPAEPGVLSPWSRVSGGCCQGTGDLRGCSSQMALSYLPTAPRLRSTTCVSSSSLLSTGPACCSASHPFSEYQHEKFKYYPSLSLFSKTKPKTINSLDSHFPHAKGGHNTKHSLTDSCDRTKQQTRS